MIDAIFIQSWHQELIDGRLNRLIGKINDNIHTTVPIYTFIDKKTTLLPEAMSIVNQLTDNECTRFVYVDDTKYQNAQTTVFYTLLTSMTDAYKRVLLLETDCVLLPEFDKYINSDLSSINHDDWWIVGSCYYGDAANTTIDNDSNFIRRNHLNGVAVYNRTTDYLDYARDVFVTRGKLNDEHAFDWVFALEYFDSVYSETGKLLDSEYIINLSPVWDKHVDYRTRKPRAKIIHQKLD
jgi:hypothetical protein